MGTLFIIIVILGLIVILYLYFSDANSLDTDNHTQPRHPNINDNQKESEQKDVKERKENELHSNEKFTDGVGDTAITNSPNGMNAVNVDVPTQYLILCIPFLENKELNIDYKKRIFVKYSISNSIEQTFPIIRAPKKGTEIKYPVVGRNGNRGFSEQSFCNEIKKCHLEHNFYDNLSLFCGYMTFPYEPDLAYIDIEKGIFLDIEIDEPYIGWERSPIHYKTNEGTIDDIRNKHFTDRGWCVIRFSEKQIQEQPLSCLKEIFNLLHSMDASIVIPNKLSNADELKKDEWWSKGDAENKAKRREREKYLHISKFIMPIKERIISVKDYEEGKLLETRIIRKPESVNNLVPKVVITPPISENKPVQLSQKDTDIQSNDKITTNKTTSNTPSSRGYA